MCGLSVSTTNFFIKVDTVPNVTEITIVWGIRLWFNSFRGNACHMVCVRYEERNKRVADGSMAVREYMFS